MDDLVKVIPLSLELCPRSPGTKTPLWYQINCMWLKRQNVLLAVMGSRKGLTVNQLCFSSAMNMNYDNLDILVVKPKRQENQSFWVPAKVCGTRTSRQKHGSDLQFISRLSHPHQNQWHISHPSLSNHSSWEAWNHQLGWLSRKVCEGVSNAVRHQTSFARHTFHCKSTAIYLWCFLIDTHKQSGWHRLCRL